MYVALNSRTTFLAKAPIHNRRADIRTRCNYPCGLDRHSSKCKVVSTSSLFLFLESEFEGTLAHVKGPNRFWQSLLLPQQPPRQGSWRFIVPEIAGVSCNPCVANVIVEVIDERCAISAPEVHRAIWELCHQSFVRSGRWPYVHDHLPTRLIASRCTCSKVFPARSPLVMCAMCALL